MKDCAKIHRKLSPAMEKLMPLLLLFLCLERLEAIFVPLKAPVTYCTNDTKDCKHDIPVYANRLASVESVITYTYDRFDFCEADNDMPDYHANIGQILSGDRINKSPYKLKFREDVICQEVCSRRYKAGNQADEKSLNFTKDAIFLNYYHHWLADDIPVTWCYTVEDGTEYCALGFPLGCHVTMNGRQKDACVMRSWFNRRSSFYVFNHVDIEVEYSQNDETGSADGGQILAIRVKPDSCKSQCQCVRQPLYIPAGRLLEDMDITYTYSVKWKENKHLKWSSRWDRFGPMHRNILAFSAANSVIIVVFLAFCIATIWLKMHNKWICSRARVDMVKWKMLYPFVFRPPSNKMLLSVLCGSGLQVFLMAMLTDLLACIGIVTIANPGSTILGLLATYAVMGLPAGYVAARFYRTFSGRQPVLQTTLLAILCPGISLLVFLVMDTVQRMMGSSSAATASAHLTLFGFWFGSMLCTFAGAYLGCRKGANYIPCKTDLSGKKPEIPRKRILHGLCAWMSSILPTGVVYISMFFILNSLWQSQTFTLYGSLLGILSLFALTTILLAMLITFFHLSTQDYQWWWRAFLSVSFTGVFIFLYSLHYFFTKTEYQDGISVVVYISYNLLLGFLIFLACGALGLIGSFVFVVRIYSFVQKNIEEEGEFDTAETLM